MFRRKIYGGGQGDFSLSVYFLMMEASTVSDWTLPRLFSVCFFTTPMPGANQVRS